MSIQIWIGNLGSGKTAAAVRYMSLNPQEFFYTNINNSLKNTAVLSTDMICRKELLKTKKSGEEVFKFKVNTDFWYHKAKKPCSVVLDEAHIVMNPRRSMTNLNIVITDWLALLRRILGEDSRGFGDLILITQLPNRIELVAREMATNILRFVCFYTKLCNTCGVYWSENSDMPEPLRKCPSCSSIDLQRRGFVIMVKAYSSMANYNFFKVYGTDTAYRKYFIINIQQYFGKYNTLQWDNLLSSLY